MASITQYLPEDTPIVDAIFDHYKREGDKEEARCYLGASSIGHECDRFLWYSFRGCTKEDFPGRLYRLFETGDLEEIRMIKDLRSIGCEIHDIDPTTGKQFEVSALAGHFSGHMDGCGFRIPTAEKTWHVLEFKTHNRKHFATLQKEKVQVSNPKHYAQIQIYTHLTGMRRALYLAVNKDTDELYAERVYYNEEHAKALMVRAERIIFAQEPPARMTNRRDWYECKFCSAYDLCWASGEVALPVSSVSCRQCCHATPTRDGHARWICEKHGRGLSWKDQQAHCDDHLILPGLLGFAEPTNYGKTQAEGNEYIEFTNADGQKWQHGRTFFKTQELRALPISALVSPMLVSVKELFGAEAKSCFSDNILTRYPEGDSELVWRGQADKLQEEWLKKYKVSMNSCKIISKVNTGDYRAVEFEGGRLAVVRYDRGLHPAEIWQGKE